MVIKDSEGYTAIMLAAYEGNMEAIQALVKAGANTKTQNNESETALQIAESRQHEAIVEFLKDH
ncbi:MAG: ankyrin repeat domain-containing protein [Leptospirales bacterium]